MEIASYLLSMQRAMLLHITPNLRAIKLDINKNSIKIFMYYDNKPCDEERDLAENCHTEFIADFPSEKSELKIIVLPFPENIPNIGYSIYRRYEGSSTINAYLTQKAMEALIGNITYNLRAAYVLNQDDLITFTLFYDKSLSNIEMNLIKIIENRFKLLLPQNWNSLVQIKIMPSPEVMPKMGAEVFKKYEN